MSIILGLTGPTGAGKSSVSQIARDMGIKVVDCDIVSRKAVEPSSDGLKALVSSFGNSILNSDGSLNRKALAEKAFSCKQNTDLLNKTILPFIVEIIKNEIHGEAVILDAPTLFESGLDSICDDTVAVLADEKIRLERIISRDKLTLKEAKLRISAGKTDEFFIQNAGHILKNNGNMADFINDAKALFKNLFGGNINV